MSSIDKALEACRAYSQWQGEIRRLTRAIGDALCACEGINGDLQKWDEGGDETHLKDIYRGYTEEGYQVGEQHYHYTDAEVVEHLTEHGCTHCLAAHRLIQQRKAARQKFGAANRWIGKLGKAASIEVTAGAAKGGDTNSQDPA